MTDTIPSATGQTAPRTRPIEPCYGSKIGVLVEQAANEERRTLGGRGIPPDRPLVGPILAPGLPVAVPILKATKDQAFDPFMSFSKDVFDLAMDDLTALCDEASPRRRRRKLKDAEHHRLVLASVTANALRAAFHPTSQTVHYPRGVSAYSGHSIYYPDFLRTILLKRVIDSLEKARLLETSIGKKERQGKRWVRLQSTFTATLQLIEFFDVRNITPNSLIRLDGRPTIILRDKRKRDIFYNPDAPDIAAMAHAVKRYNGFITRTEISLDLPEAEIDLMHATPERTGGPRPPINYDDKELCRIFNNSNFEEGGRFFRGWWINAPKEYRDHILINGRPTIEKDYSGCFLRMLYHLEGKAAPEDPYAIPKVMELTAEQGLNWKVVRTAIKRLTNIYLNASRQDEIRFFPDIACNLPAGLNEPEQIYRLIKETHQPIAHNFRTGYGTKLMRYESDLCSYVLDNGVKEQVPVLPIHDSFRVERDRAAWLEQVMTEAYQASFPGFKPRIE